MRTTLKTLILAASLVCGSAYAHDTDLACAKWETVATFDFSSGELMAFAQRTQASGGVCMPKSCGIVDDHWSVATLYAFNYCERIAPGSEAKVTAPGAYNDPLLHHTDYHFGPGTPNLKGECRRCVVPRSGPIKLPSARAER